MRLAVAVVALVVAGCAQSHASPTELEYLGQKENASGYVFDGTTVGGLSAISYDPATQLYYIVSDDRSEHNPARFYAARINLSDNGIDDVEFDTTSMLLRPDGLPFPPKDVNTVPPDPEGIAFDPRRQVLYWSSEGERITDDGPAVLLDPWVRISTLDGVYVGEFELPPSLRMSAEDTGPRKNSALEGLALSPDGSTLFTAMEGPTFDDGPLPDADHGGITRITALDVETRKPVAQYAYPLEPAAGLAETNGLTDLVALSDTEFLVIERAGSPAPVIRIWKAQIGGVTNILGKPVDGTAMTKSLMVDLSETADVGLLDNIEGITFGPVLPDGRQSVVLVSDDNFNSVQVTQFLLLAL